MEKRNDLVCGLWKFADSKVSKEEIIALAEEFAQDASYIELYVRKASKDQHGLGFVYKYDGEQTSYEQFTDSMQDMLLKKFGTGLSGWDISSSCITIKGFSQ